MSVPPGTEMFQFPGFASRHYGFMSGYPIGVGCPIRTSTDQRLLAAPRGFSQRATSFIASWCQGIHRMPFSCSIHMPRRPADRSPTTQGHRHAQKPASETVVSFQSPVVRDNQRRSPDRPSRGSCPSLSISHIYAHTPLTARRPTAGRPVANGTIPVRHAAERRPDHPVQRPGQKPPTPENRNPTPDDAPRDAPEPDSHCQRPHPRTTHPTGHAPPGRPTASPATIPDHRPEPHHGMRPNSRLRC
jgi:hypothetical protein